ncbi:MAG: hypothetical protein R3A48_26565 [Polyangiales bacterium]
MNRTALLALALALSASGCHRRRHRRPHRPRAAATAPRWYVAPVGAPAVRVREGYTLHGAVRAENGRAAPAPYPLTPIVASARMADGTWRFAAEDGSLYRARRFTAPLDRDGALPFALEAPAAREGAALQGAHGEGALVVRARDLSAHVVGDGGRARRLPLHDVLAAISVDARTLLALTEPGALMRSLDGGETFEALRPPAGVALALWMGDDGPRLRTTAGTLAYRGGALVPDGSELTAARSLAVPDDVSERLQRSLFHAPWDLSGASSASGGPWVFTLEGERLRVLRARDGATLSDEAAPGSRCALSPAFEGVGAVCTRGWARVVLSRRSADPGWRILRDERDAQPVGEVRFDARSRLWVTAAPCAQRREAREALCIVDEDAVAREVLHQGELIAAHDRRVIVRTGGFLRVLDARGEEVSRAPYLLEAPEGFDARPLAEGVALIPRGAHARDAWVFAHDAWRAVRLPGRYARVTDGGEWIAWSSDASTLQRSRDGARFEPMPSPVLGDASALALGDEALGCAAGWCRLGERLLLGPGAPPQGEALARPDRPAPDARLTPQRTLRCEHGASTPAAEIDHGAASTGYAVRAEALGPDSLAVTWEGDALRGRARVTVPRREGATMEVRGVPFATAPMALVTRCDTRGCDHLLVTRDGATDLRLGRAAPSGVEAHAWEGGAMIRVDDARPEGSTVTLVRVDARGALGRRRTYALAGRLEDAAAGRWGDRDGLWTANPSGTLRFYPLDGVDDVAVTPPAPDARTAPCAPDERGEGEARWVHAVPVVRGDGWFLERGRWQHEEQLSLSSGRVCVRRLGAGEPHEEREARGTREERVAVRSLTLRPGAGGYVGEAWAGRRRIALRCNAIE